MDVVFDLINKEILRQRETIDLIASENYASPNVLKAMGTPLSNKYAEGYPRKRYYAGNNIVDEIEEIAIERAKKLFNAEHANVQPHAGAIANFSAYAALIKPGDKIMGLSLKHGGHLTHGSSVNFSGKIYKPVPYFLDEHGFIDYDAIYKLAYEEKPSLIITGYSAYPREIDFKRFREIADAVGAYLLADISHIAGLVVAGEHNHPFPYADVVTSTTHKTLRGPRGAVILSKKEYAKSIDKAVFPGTQGGPLENVIAAKAICFYEAMQPSFKSYARQIKKNAKAMANAFLELGYSLVSGGTDNHLMLIDLRNKHMTGAEAQDVLEKVNIILNKNGIPNDPLPPSKTSGIRIGTPAITTRGMRESESRYIAELIHKALTHRDNSNVLSNVREEVIELAESFDIYSDFKLIV